MVQRRGESVDFFIKRGKNKTQVLESWSFQRSSQRWFHQQKHNYKYPRLFSFFCTPFLPEVDSLHQTPTAIRSGLLEQSLGFHRSRSRQPRFGGRLPCLSKGLGGIQAMLGAEKRAKSAGFSERKKIASGLFLWCFFL